MKILDANHPDLARILNHIGLNFQNTGDYFNSVGYYTRAIYIFAALRNDTVEQRNEVALAFCNLATSYQYLADFMKSNECLYQALAIYNGVCMMVKNEETEGNLADTYSHIAINYLNLHDYKKSIEYFESSLEIYKRIYDGNNLSIAQTLNNIGTSYQLLAEYEKSIEYFERSVDVFKNVYGDPAHPSVAAGNMNVENSRKMMESFGEMRERGKATEAESYEIIINPLKSIMNFFIRVLSVFKMSK
jgi:tetratricopeptide (TPR) repeat protein